jgi:hypothetical protein
MQPDIENTCRETDTADWDEPYLIPYLAAGKAAAC